MFIVVDLIAGTIGVEWMNDYKQHLIENFQIYLAGNRFIILLRSIAVENMKIGFKG